MENKKKKVISVNLAESTVILIEKICAEGHFSKSFFIEMCVKKTVLDSLEKIQQKKTDKEEK